MTHQFPFTVEVPSPLKVGSLVEIRGIPIVGATEFVVSLLVKRAIGVDADIALQFKPQLDGSTEIGCISVVGEDFEEQINYFPVFPFSQDQNFILLIEVKEALLQINVNDKPLLEYSHRIQPQSITHVVLDGDAIFESVEFFNLTSTNRITGSTIVKPHNLSRDSRSSGYTSQSSDYEQNIDVEFIDDNVCVAHFQDLKKGMEQQKDLQLMDEVDANIQDINIYGVKNSDEPIRADIDFETSVTGQQTVFTFKQEDRDISKCLSLPHMYEIPDEFGIGRAVYIDGVINRNPVWFEVCLQAGNQRLPHSTAAFHMKVDFETKTATCNTFALKNWGLERVKEGNFPFEAGKPFLIKVLAKEDCFQVIVDGNVYLEFMHRVSVERVTHVVVNGSAQVYTVECPDELELPYCAPIPGGLHEGKTIFITGAPWKDAEYFWLALQCGPKFPEEGTTPFHMKITLDPGDRKAICSSHINNIWSDEEVKYENFPFEFDKKFVMKIVVEPECFKIKVNDEILTEFTHKLPFERITHISADGELALYSVTYRDKWIGRRHSKAYHIVKSCCPTCALCVIL